MGKSGIEPKSTVHETDVLTIALLPLIKYNISFIFKILYKIFLIIFF